MSERKSFWKTLDDNAERWMLLGFYGMIVATIVVEVVRRFVLSYSSIWGEEIARYAFIYLAWVGASIAVKDRAHIRIDVILHYLRPRAKAAIYLFGDFATLTLALIAHYWSLDPILTSLKFGSLTHGLRISNAWFLAAVPIGFAMMVFRLVQSILRDWRDFRSGRPVFEGAKLFD